METPAYRPLQCIGEFGNQIRRSEHAYTSRRSYGISLK